MNDERDNRMSLNEAQLEGLLREFFRNEVPSELNRPFVAPARANTPTLTILSDAPADTRGPARHRRSPMAVISALAAIAMTAVVVMNWDPAGSHVPQTSERTPVVAPEERLMDVSKDGGAKKSTQVVGEDGVTLEETDGVDLAPRK
ncbi:MAG: hypothetical protein JNM43_07470 [Planctomycetaceae bacterium]|nr:hypothetical protein [Planctomycetaceae bacterium]